MRACLRNHAALVAVLACLLGAAAPAALAGFGSTLGGGSMTLASLALAAPTGAAAANNAATCQRRNASTLTVAVTWTATSSSWAAGYAILRGTASGGPFTQVGTVSGVGVTSWTDSTGQLAFSTAYYYVVQATDLSWTSPSSNVASVTTLSKLCA